MPDLIAKTMSKEYDKEGSYIFYECSECQTVNDYGANKCQGCNKRFEAGPGVRSRGYDGMESLP